MRKRRVKYHNVKCEYNGLKFDSKTEMEYYKYLLGLQEKGIVKEIKTQIKYSLQDKFKYKDKVQREIVYIADFVVIYSDGREEVIDTKGSVHNIDPVFKIKRKLLLCKYPNIDFRVIVKEGKKGNYKWVEIMN